LSRPPLTFRNPEFSPAKAAGLAHTTCLLMGPVSSSTVPIRGQLRRLIDLCIQQPASGFAGPRQTGGQQGFNVGLVSTVADTAETRRYLRYTRNANNPSEHLPRIDTLGSGAKVGRLQLLPVMSAIKNLEDLTSQPELCWCTELVFGDRAPAEGPASLPAPSLTTKPHRPDELREPLGEEA
jgi:hypothetical protein